MIFFGYQYCTNKAMVDRAAHWPRVSAVVDIATMSTTYSRRSTTYTPHIQYHFTRGKHRYASTVIAFPNPTFSDSTSANNFMTFYREGSVCSAYCNPENPNQCCLRPLENGNLNSELWLTFLTGFGALILPFIPDRRNYSTGMYYNPTGMITPSR